MPLIRTLETISRACNTHQAVTRTVWLAIILVVIVLGLLPQAAPPTEYDADKFIHAGVFAALAGLGRLSFDRRAGWLVALAMIGLGIAIEIGQSMVPGRDGSVNDALANAVGVLIGATIAELLLRSSGARSQA